MSDVSNGKEQTAASGPRSGYEEDADERSGLLQLAILSLAAGAVTGLVVALYRLCLDRSDQLRHVFIDWAHQWGVAGLSVRRVPSPRPSRPGWFDDGRRTPRGAASPTSRRCSAANYRQLPSASPR